MRIESARALKQEVLGKLAALAALEPRGATAQSRRLDNRPRASGAPFAVGIAGQSRDSKLAIRKLRLLTGHEERILEEIKTTAKGEVDIRYIGPIWSRARGTEIPWFRDRNRPLRIGVSVAHKDVAAGTLGGFVRCNRTAKTMILSNNHILANEGRAQSGDAVFQPGPRDGGAEDDRIGHYSRCCALIRTGAPNHIDAAVAALDDEVAFDPGALGAKGRLSKDVVEQAALGELVHKIGRTTGLTSGVISAIEVTLPVQFEIGILNFEGQVEVTSDPGHPFSDGGDSGSLVFDERNGPVGLVFGGTDSTEGFSTTFVNPISIILDKLGVSLLV